MFHDKKKTEMGVAKHLLTGLLRRKEAFTGPWAAKEMFMAER